MFFCPGSIGLLNDDDESDWDIDNFYNHPSSIQAYHHHHGDADNKFSKMGSLMFVVDVFFLTDLPSTFLPPPSLHDPSLWRKISLFPPFFLGRIF